MPAYFTCVPTPAPPSVALAGTENILLLGSDLRAGDRLWHTDTMILVAIDHQNNQVGVLSFPRDYWLYIPGYYRTDGSQFDRINVVDYVGERVMKVPDGGFGLLKQVFQYDFGIRLDRFIRLHRQGFVDIVDKLGGIDINLDCELWDFAPTPDGESIGDVLHLPAGPNHLDGETALKYATYRYGSTDWDRARRQQTFLLAAREQFVRVGTLFQVPALWPSFKDYFSTNLGLGDIIGLARLAADLDMQAVHAHVIGAKDVERVNPDNPAYIVTSKGDAVFQEIENAFSAPSIVQEAQRPGQCPPKPGWAETYLTPAPPTPTPTPGS